MIDVGIVLIAIFSVACLVLLIQIISGILLRKKLHRMLEQGYYFLELETGWGRKVLKPIPPGNVDLSSGSPRLISNIIIRQ
ncbi:uncharacterized protein LOC126880124 isoform X2 [Diabrotica virgifera virgifera]|uniref:Uncharacterized protein n=1 Tax=Diabrotica virgifera virgifera TaxID=50390 RepID=A0ABM5JPB6_DIAVI|nr:uncharacterized protein LOC126880124 isoform X2 [Diabrotica virgifera virgifera]